MRNCSIRVIASLLALSLGVFALGAKRQDTSEKEEVRVESKPIPSTVVYELTRTVGAGRVVKAHDGKAGALKRIYRIKFSHGKPSRKELLREERVEATPTLMLMGKTGFETSRHSFRRSRVMVMSATAYDPSPETIGPGATGRTRTGRIAEFGCVAVDPRVIPLGSLLYVEGYGMALACDTGGAIKGNRIDLCYASRAVADRYGRKRVRVHILRPAR